MNFYQFVQTILFKLDPEKAHKLSLNCLQFLYRLGGSKIFNQPISPLTVMDLHFQNPIGLAAGLDKDADYIDGLAMLGFGFIEIGTVTPKPQPGNPTPRLFRLTESKAIINRMGFNSKGAEYVARRLEKTHYQGIMGINIGKNKETPLDHAIDDYIYGFRYLSPYAHYITINISSPNTEGLRNLQQEDFLVPLLSALKKEQAQLFLQQKKYVPLVVKISPDLTPDELLALPQIFLNQQIDGIIATNTTTTRTGIEHIALSEEIGGLSGAPLLPASTDVLAILHDALGDKIPIIASGGIMDTESGERKKRAGASLLQIYTGLIYRGPDLIHQLANLF
jgi:dihydroorotate dehydrogenase